MAAIVHCGSVSNAQIPGSSTADDITFPGPVDPVTRAPIFFPPNPPPLDRPVSHLAASMPIFLTPPGELAAYASEIFYPALGTRFSRHDLSGKLRRQLDDYTATRATLRNELHAELDRLRGADDATRRAALERFARQQTPRIITLEESAERLRENLIVGDYTWSANRMWRLGENAPRGDSPTEVAQVMRAYAFYHIGISVAQRGLLREIAVEMMLAAEDATSAAAAQPYFFFSPEFARVQLADDLPPTLAAQVAEYQTKKSALKKELFDAVYEQEKASILRGNTLKAVALKQTSRLAELERLAEEIRRGLADLPSSSRSGSRSPLPPVLTARVAALLQNRTALQKETIAKIDEIRRQSQAAGGMVRVNFSFDSTGLKFTVGPTFGRRSNTSKELVARIETITQAMSVVAADYGRRFADLANETDAIRREATATMGNPTVQATETALNDTVRYAALQDTNVAYRDYRTAVFEPGLSAEQRRLLFGHAVEELDLPLPRGELQPTSRGPW